MSSTPSLSPSKIGSVISNHGHQRDTEILSRKTQIPKAQLDNELEMNDREIKKSETLYIFDWDDTILCTSILD